MDDKPPDSLLSEEYPILRKGHLGVSVNWEAYSRLMRDSSSNSDLVPYFDRVNRELQDEGVFVKEGLASLVRVLVEGQVYRIQSNGRYVPAVFKKNIDAKGFAVWCGLKDWKLSEDN